MKIGKKSAYSIAGNRNYAKPSLRLQLIRVGSGRGGEK
jgi:hypothetical protein